MARDEGSGRLGAWPEQPASRQPARGAPRLRSPERRQIELRAVSLDELIAADHRARFVWAFAERLDLTPLYQAIKSTEGRPGHPAADPRLLLALWLYATVEGVGSARELDRLCREHVGFQWLCGGVSLNHVTLAEFRVAHGAVLERLLIDSFAAMLRTGQASLDRIAQDGMRVRAAAGAASFRRLGSLARCREAAAARLKQLRAELDADPGALTRRQAAQRERAARERQQRVEAAAAALAKLTRRRADPPAADPPAADPPPPDPPAAVQSPAAPEPSPAAPPAAVPSTDRSEGAVKRKPAEPRASTTDAEARVMKMADGGFRPAFNVGFATDTRSGMIAGVALDNHGTDMGKLSPMSDKLAADYGRRPAEHLADGGFVALDDIERLGGLGVAVFAPPPKPRQAGRDRYAPLPSDEPGVAAWRTRMGQDAAKSVYKERAATAELANAQCRNRGLLRFLVRGVEKARAVTLLHALAHNMTCTLRLQAA
jgi:transposase